MTESASGTFPPRIAPRSIPAGLPMAGSLSSRMSPPPSAANLSANPACYNESAYAGFLAKFSAQRIFAVACIAINSVNIAPIVIVSPVKPWKKNA